MVFGIIRIMEIIDMSSQVEMVSLEELVPYNHSYMKFKELWDFSDIKHELEKIEMDSDHKGYAVFRLFLYR